MPSSFASGVLIRPGIRFQIGFYPLSGSIRYLRAECRTKSKAIAKCRVVEKRAGMRCLGVATTWLLLLHLYIVACFEPVSTFIVTGTIGVLGAVILKKAINSLYYSECCNQPWIQLNDTGQYKGYIA